METPCFAQTLQTIIADSITRFQIIHLFAWNDNCKDDPNGLAHHLGFQKGVVNRPLRSNNCLPIPIRSKSQRNGSASDEVKGRALVYGDICWLVYVDMISFYIWWSIDPNHPILGFKMLVNESLGAYQKIEVLWADLKVQPYPNCLTRSLSQETKLKKLAIS